jgi:DNA mismatch endonuclease (patch repair protein)
MKKVRRSRTAPEEAVAAILRELGIRANRNVRGLPGTPDFANKRRKFAIFVHGCFWHGHEGCRLAKVPASNQEFWSTKLAGNRARDAAKARALRAVGLHVVTIWQCDLPKVATTKLKRLRNRLAKAE